MVPYLVYYEGFYFLCVLTLYNIIKCEFITALLLTSISFLYFFYDMI